MAQKNRNFFGSLTSTADGEDSATQRKRRSGYLQDRESTLSQLTSGEMMDKTLLWVEPEQCRMWQRHNRRYDLLNERRCADLIEGFKAQGKQEFPAIVRRSKKPGDCEYEVICGARRHWTVTWLRKNNYPDFKFLIEIRDLTDEQAFRLSDIENRDRVDISDYERAIDYKSALTAYYESSQKKMAQRLEVSEAWLSYYLRLAELPEIIVSAYTDIADIKIQHARDLAPLLKDRHSRERVLESARELKKKQKNESNGTGLDGQSVIRVLKRAGIGARRAEKASVFEYKSQEGTKILSAARSGRMGLMLRVFAGSGVSRSELVRAFEEALTEFFGDKIHDRE